MKHLLYEFSDDVVNTDDKFTFDAARCVVALMELGLLFCVSV